MPNGVQGVLLDWAIPWWPTAALLLTGLIYWRGWRLIRRTRPRQFPIWRLVCFQAGLLSLFVALASPLDTLDEQLLVLHMMQHLILMSVAPPLLLLGAPVVPLLRGLPRRFVRRVLGPLFRTRWLHAIQHLLQKLTFAWLAMNLAYIGWHVPAAYELALRSDNWHDLEHACFFFGSILFWWPIISPWPSRFRGSRWLILPYMLTADVVNTAISASLCFAGRLMYPSYGLEPRLFGINALNDQIAAGALMWVMGSMFFLVPAFFITMHLLSPKESQPFYYASGTIIVTNTPTPR